MAPTPWLNYVGVVGGLLEEPRAARRRELPAPRGAAESPRAQSARAQRVRRGDIIKEAGPPPEPFSCETLRFQGNRHASPLSPGR